MANILEDNTVIPSYFGIRTTGFGGDSGMMTNTGFRVGEVRELIHPDDDRNVNGRFLEYTVEVQERDGSGPGTSTKYAGCVLMNLFGSVADVFRFSLRADAQDQKRDDGIGIGAKVLLLCVNGNTTKAVIVGGLRDTGTDKDGTGYQGKDLEADGHNLFFEFNGAQVTINKDGELQVKFRGQTKTDGTLGEDAIADAEGSTATFTKEGGIKLATKDAAQFIHVDHANKKIDILADADWHVKVNERLSFDVGNSIEIRGGTHASVDVSDNIYLRSAGVRAGAATEAWVQGTTYRAAEQQLHAQMIGTLTAMGTSFATMAAAFSASAPLNATPVVGGALALPGFQAAGAAMAALAPQFTALAGALQTFEALTTRYLSRKNFGD